MNARKAFQHAGPIPIREVFSDERGTRDDERVAGVETCRAVRVRDALHFFFDCGQRGQSESTRECAYAGYEFLARSGWARRREKDAEVWDITHREAFDEEARTPWQGV